MRDRGRLTTTIAAALMALLFAFPAAAAPAKPDHAPPKIANFYLKWAITDTEARELSKWDLVVLDMEVQATPGVFRLMRELNPKIRILAYVTPSEIRSDAAALGQVAPLRRDLLASIQDPWFVTDAGGNRRSFWSGTWIVNVTDRAPLVNGKRWNQTLPEFVRDRVMATGLWDGVMYDNGWENITWFAGGQVDLDRDGRAEGVADEDAAWRAGLKTLFRNTRALLPNALVLENDGALYASEVHGLQFENFPNGTWSGVMGKVATAGGQALSPKLVIVNGNTRNTGNREDWRAFRFGLGSALLADAYYGFDYGDQDHGQTWWYDEYAADLGPPGAAPARQDGSGAGWRAGVWRRDYGRGAVVVNSGGQAKSVDLGAELERLHGSQDPARNDGAIASRVTVASQDAVLLVKPLGEVRGAAFRNGSFVRVFDAAGKVARTGFFAFADRFSGTATLLTRVVKGENREVIVADGSHARIYGPGYAQIADLVPFGADFKGGISIAVGDLDGDGSGELIAATRDAGGGRVRVFTLAGASRADFRAFGDVYAGGASVAAGDLDGDGKAEIVVGAGSGGGPHVRVFDGNGRLVNAGFFAYDPKFRGGVRVAAGDLDLDGKAEIVTGPGPGGGPHVRVFDRTGRIKSQFMAFDARGRSGASVGVADVDRNGRPDILAFSNDISGLAAASPTAPVAFLEDAPLEL